MEKSSNPKIKSSRWHYQPNLDQRMAPYYEWPPRVGESIRKALNGWSPLDVRPYVLIAAILFWWFLSPDLLVAAEFDVVWILKVWLRWLLTIFIVAGGLHLYFYTFKKQGRDEKYQLDDLERSSARFHFGNQVWDNMFWVLFGTVGTLTFYECVMLWAYANSAGSILNFDQQPVLFSVLILLTPGWTAFHFYWQHRAFHIPALYRLGHHWHHKNVNVGPWSGAAVHPLENLVWFSAVLVLLLVPSHPIHALFLLHLQVITAITTHVGFDRLKLSADSGFQLGDFFHQLHHRHFNCNYGTMSGPWDRWFGTYNDGTGK